MSADGERAHEPPASRRVRHHYPEALAAEALRALAALGAPPALCDLDLLGEIFSVAYQATLLREEERPLTFRLLVAPHEEVARALAVDDAAARSPLHKLVFTTPRPFDEHEIRRLALAAKFQRSLVGVDPGAPCASIWGLVHTGPAWLREAQGARGPHLAPVPHLVVAATGPGRVLATYGGKMVARLAAGKTAGVTADVFDSSWLPARFAPVRDEIWRLHEEERAREGLGPSPLDPDLVRALGASFIRRIIAGMQLSRHGGALVIVPPACSEGVLRSHRFVDLKYQFADAEPRRRFRTVLLAILRRLAQRAGGASDPRGWAAYGADSDDEIAALDNALFELARGIAALADVDGCVLLTQRFEVIGFGGLIRGDVPEVSTVFRAADLEGLRSTPEPADRMGTRHRSVYRLCQAFPEALGMVLSQDGSVRFVTWRGQGVTHFDQVGPLGY